MLEDDAIADDPRFATNSDRIANRADLDAVITRAFARHDRDALADLLEEAGIANGRVNDMADLASHPQIRHIEVATPSGDVRLLASGEMIDGASPAAGAVPALDADGARRRREFGGA